MFTLLLRDSVYKKIMSILNKCNKPFSEIELRNEVAQEDVPGGVKFEFSFVIRSYNIIEMVNFFNKYFYACSKCQSIQTSASSDGNVVFLTAHVIITKDMIDSLL